MKATISGIRGVVGEDIGPRDVAGFCAGFAGMIDGGACVLGRDTRPSGGALMGAAAAGLAAGGADVVDMGVVPTPVVYREARRYGAGVVVTSSHNPLSWNGLKFVVEGRGAGVAELRRIMDGGYGAMRRYGSRRDAGHTYVEDAAGVIGSVDGVRVLVDAGGGAATDVAPRLLRHAGCRVDAIRGGTPRPDPTAGGLEALTAGSSKYDMGVAFDMDGDRMVLAMDGAVQPPDATLGLGVAAAMRRGHRDFVFSVDTSVLVERYVTERGGTVARCPVGEANVTHMMAECGAPAGGEGSSGGFILGGFNWCRDGMLAAGLAASLVHEGGVREALGEVTGSTIIRQKVCGDASALARVREHIRHMCSEVDTRDGVRGIMDEDSWVLVRVSNTEDVVRVSAEDSNPERCAQTIRDIERRIRG